MRPAIAPDEAAGVLERYPDLAAGTRFEASSLSINSAVARLGGPKGRYALKRYDRGAGLETRDEHTLVLRLVQAGYPTPRLHRNREGETITRMGPHDYALYDWATGEDRYRDRPVFAGFESVKAARSAGACLAHLHLALAAPPWPGPRRFGGLCATYELLLSREAVSPLADLLAGAPELAAFVRARGGLVARHARFDALRLPLMDRLSDLPQGPLHGDFLARNLLWEGDRVSAVLDLDLWNVAPWAFDVALALLPCGFDWPVLLAGRGAPRWEAMREMVAGYEAVRPLAPLERSLLADLLPLVRFEFYLGAMHHALKRGEIDRCSRFWDLQGETLAYFLAHPVGDRLL